MQPRNNLGLKDIICWSLLFAPIYAAALQQQSRDGALLPSKAVADRLSVAERFQDSLDAGLSGRGRKNTYTEQNHSNDDRDRSRSREKRTSKDERALATYAAAESDPAVRAPPAPRSSATAGLTSRQPARSLQDWRVEDIVLLATVDGKLHARDRTTGAARWQLEVDTPMVETVYHRHNRSLDENGVEVDDPVWIVEPSQDGSIYLYAPGSGLGMQRMGFTVKQLADMGPFAEQGQPAMAYNAEKKTTLYTIDAATGNILKVFSSAGAISNDDRSCRRVNPLESLEEEDECEPIGTLLLGRTEYTIGVQSLGGDAVSTIKYFEWGPNNRDEDLKSKYTTTMDRKYVYSRYDGSVFGLDLGSASGGYKPVPANKPVYREKFASPVVRVFDLVRQKHETSDNAALVVLPQPVGPALDELTALDDDAYENVFVNCTESGSWYALSETNYPAVTEGAQPARLYHEGDFALPILPMTKAYRDRFMGVHQLSPIAQRPGSPLIGAPDYPGIEAPPNDSKFENSSSVILSRKQPTWRDNLPSVTTFVMAILVVSLTACGALYREKLQSAVQKPVAIPKITTTLVDIKTIEEAASETPTMVREDEPAMEVIFPLNGAESDVSDSPPKEDDTLVRTETVEGAEEDEDSPKDVKENKPKHKRGKRGGKKQKEKDQASAEAKAAKKTVEVPQPSEVISVTASESPEVAGPLQINSLVIHKDKLIGQGSSGTLVFEGSFEGRGVAVKRMLSQHYELALQEVSFLQQSDDHPNVVRYFCQQKDDHFLYIAVELCQASLYDVWDYDRAKTEERQQQLRALKLAIQQDPPRALQQLAAGLYHLHNLRIIHRDIKPQNILVAFPKRGQPAGPRLVISDFGLGKNLPENASTINDATMNAGTSGWKAPELISQPRDTDSRHSQSHNTNNGSESGTGTSGIKRAADIFSLGCLFFWVLTSGTHPYEDESGWQGLRELNIKRGKKNMGALEQWSDAYEPSQLVDWMTAQLPEHRPTALQVLNHPFFWSREKRLGFLCDCSDHFEREVRGVVDDGYAGDSEDLRLLEDRAPEVIGRNDFLSKLDRSFVDTLGKQRKYSGNRLLDLLRALRNKKNHYEDMPDDVKRRVGPLAGGYLTYWTDRFPRLLMICYMVIHEAGIQNTDRFKGYFDDGSRSI
ncbi:bifunctional endoribonuclease/protein kinase ire1 [Recurvomyces mirabilis]|uniref:non-specific serine/threonine protein kinase n=1 Tax=Recurvomyces mirabilis TaxID=574656 RepID=A0AAE1C4E5_9PEZI|nr:bifunctional endoribonuclease/protein kinase ire1 [Recurvomyces mirabilis]KAK5157477.1 bifunctional endoribonuclease/protein kinase ire1 [Recurvomyces mirabilis]